MKILFAHQNYPGQFGRLSAALIAEGHQVTAFGMAPTCRVPGVDYHRYDLAEGPDPAEFNGRYRDWVHTARRGYAVADLAVALRRTGYAPDVIVCNTGWGESLFLKDIWPKARVIAYLEYYYAAEGQDVGFDPEFPTRNEETIWKLRLKNGVQLAAFDAADAAVAPTAYQRSVLPAYLHDRCEVIHDGIDTGALRPDPAAAIRLAPDGPSFGRGTPLVTYSTRTFEPMRGAHVFIRNLPALLRLDPALQVVCIGATNGGYGPKPGADRNWLDIFKKEVEGQVDWSRVHFVGQLPYPQYVRVLQASAAHIYLTAPFVLSWSMIESLSLGCRLVASNTPPVAEVVQHGVNGRLFPFFDGKEMVRQVRKVLRDKAMADALSAEARRTAVERYDFQTVCYPRWRQLLGVA